MTTAKGRKVCMKGWQVPGKEAVDKGLASLASLNPFQDIAPMLTGY